MSHADFVHLRVHSAYSLSEGAIKVPELVELCRQHGMPAVAMTDTNNLFGVLEFAQTAKKQGVQPVVGCQLAVARPEGSGRTGNGNGGEATPDQLVLLVQDETGYRNLIHLVSRAFLDTPSGETPHVSWDKLAAHAEGLLCLSGGPSGPVGRLLAENKDAQARESLDRLIGIFPGRLYVEVQRHGLATEEAIEDRMVQLAHDTGVPLVATNEAFFPDEGMHEAHEALLCIAEGAYLSQDNRRKLTPDHGFKPAGAMRQLFADLPEAVDNTLVVAQRCHHFPEPIDPMLPSAIGDGRSEIEVLRETAEQGLRERLATHVHTADMDADARERAAQPYWHRLQHELDVIENMGFPGYFLIVADFIQWAKNKDIPVGPGRGSGAGSLVAWALLITDLDPLAWNLLFERFMNPERVNMPDFDVDFCQDRRDEVIQYVQDKYGHEHVAQIITFGKLQARAALRDVGRVLEMPFGQVDRICKLVPQNPANPVTLQEAIDGEPQLQEWRNGDEQVARLIDIALKLEGLYRHASTHAAGVVIGDRPLDALIPLYRDPRADMPVTQFNMKDVEKAGLVKFDFLGLKTLSVMARAVELLRQRDIEVNLSTIPLDDPRTYEMVSRGETVGVFQLESGGMRDVLRRLRPDRFEEMIAVVALYRPGPMDNIPSFISRKHGEEGIDYLHPNLEGILKETYGIMIYQEQVMQAAQELAGYSLGAADLLRRAMGKKIQSEMDAQREKFVEGAVERGVDRGQADRIFDQVAKFAGYGFNKSHAAAYAMIAYQTGYLKANHPVEFMAAIMTYDMVSTEKLDVFRQELERLGIPLLPPDVNRSGADFGVEVMADGTHAIRYALGALRNVGHAAMRALVAEREANGAFADLTDFADRVDTRLINKKQMEMLACAGAFDSLCANRQQVYKGADTLVRHAAAATEARHDSQVSLFGGGPAEAPRVALPEVADWPTMDRLRQEHEAIGFYLSAHPMDAYGRSLERLGVTRFAELAQAMRRDSGRKKVAGMVVGKQERRAKNSGNKFAFVQVSDKTGIKEIVVFSEALAQARELLVVGQPVLMTVEVRQDSEEIRLSAVEVADLDRAVAEAAAGLRVHLRDSGALNQLRSILDRDQKGRGRVSVVVDLDDGREVEMRLPGGYRLSAEARQALKGVAGVELEDV